MAKYLFYGSLAILLGFLFYPRHKINLRKNQYFIKPIRKMEDVTAYLRGFFHNSYVNTTYEYVQETLHSLGVSEEYQPDKEEVGLLDYRGGRELDEADSASTNRDEHTMGQKTESAALVQSCVLLFFG